MTFHSSITTSWPLSCLLLVLDVAHQTLEQLDDDDLGFCQMNDHCYDMFPTLSSDTCKNIFHCFEIR
uniref:Putative secreted protein n=1 Tax=Anopheles marajoara TaxID=58244 RepID=A0A2M4CFY5_9DIPT